MNLSLNRTSDSEKFSLGSSREIGVTSTVGDVGYTPSQNVTNASNSSNGVQENSLNSNINYSNGYNQTNQGQNLKNNQEVINSQFKGVSQEFIQGSVQNLPQVTLHSSQGSVKGISQEFVLKNLTQNPITQNLSNNGNINTQSNVVSSNPDLILNLFSDSTSALNSSNVQSMAQTFIPLKSNLINNSTSTSQTQFSSSSTSNNVQSWQGNTNTVVGTTTMNGQVQNPLNNQYINLNSQSQHQISGLNRASPVSGQYIDNVSTFSPLTTLNGSIKSSQTTNSNNTPFRTSISNTVIPITQGNISTVQQPTLTNQKAQPNGVPNIGASQIGIIQNSLNHDGLSPLSAQMSMQLKNFSLRSSTNGTLNQNKTQNGMISSGLISSQNNLVQNQQISLQNVNQSNGANTTNLNQFTSSNPIQNGNSNLNTNQLSKNKQLSQQTKLKSIEILPREVLFRICSFLINPRSIFSIFCLSKHIHLQLNHSEFFEVIFKVLCQKNVHYYLSPNSHILPKDWKSLVELYISGKMTFYLNFRNHAIEASSSCTLRKRSTRMVLCEKKIQGNYILLPETNSELGFKFIIHNQLLEMLNAIRIVINHRWIDGTYITLNRSFILNQANATAEKIEYLTKEEEEDTEFIQHYWTVPVIFLKETNELYWSVGTSEIISSLKAYGVKSISLSPII